jgi:hypothetical protein
VPAPFSEENTAVGFEVADQLAPLHAAEP